MTRPYTIRSLAKLAWELRFWIVCATIIIASVSARWLATRSLDKSRAAHAQQIRESFATLDSISDRDRIANESVQSKMQQLIQSRKRELVAAWSSKRASQESQFQWPSELGPSFELTANQLPPVPELIDSTDDVFHIGQREAFASHVQRVLPRLAESIRSAWNPNPVRDQPAEPLVTWNPASQNELVVANFPFTSLNAATPSTREIVCAHEDLCVLETILNAIETTNASADIVATVAVRNIQSLRIGRLAIKGNERLTTIGQEKATIMDSRPQMAAPQDNEYGSQSDQRLESSAANPFDQRYVDDEFAGIGSDQLRSRLETSVANHLPFRLRLAVDQRKLTALLANFANSTPILEVHQFRMIPREGRVLSNEMDRERVDFAYDIEIEVYGTVSVYQPVDLPLIGLATNEY
jgi:hypothetical protein